MPLAELERCELCNEEKMAYVKELDYYCCPEESILLKDVLDDIVDEILATNRTLEEKRDVILHMAWILSPEDDPHATQIREKLEGAVE